MRFAYKALHRVAFLCAVTFPLVCWTQSLQAPQTDPVLQPSIEAQAPENGTSPPQQQTQPPPQPKYTPITGDRGSSLKWVNPNDGLPTAKCTNNAPAGYGKSGCYVEVDRNLPISPPTLVLPKGTKVYIKLTHPHWDETIAFNDTIVRAAPQDLAADALRSLVTPGSAFAGAFQSSFFLPFQSMIIPPGHGAPSGTQSKNTVPKLQDDVRNQLNQATQIVQNAITAFTCLETYKPTLTALDGTTYCDQTGALSPADFIIHSQTDSAIDDVISDAQEAIDAPLPAYELAALDAKIKNDITACAKKDLDNTCYTDNNQLQSTEAVLDGQLTALQTAQSTIIQALQVLLHWPSQNGPAGDIFLAVMPKNVSSSIVISGTEAVTKTATTIATITINTATTKFILSSGLLYTTAPFKTYALADVYNNGVLQTTTSASGSQTAVETVVKSKSVPSIDFPLVLASFIIPKLSQAPWENRCRNHCEFLFSTGVGLNLGAKTADFFGGPSFEVGGFIVTLGALGTRQAKLIDGIYAGQTTSGGTNPTTLPTATYWSCGGGIAFTYTIPTP